MPFPSLYSILGDGTGNADSAGTWAWLQAFGTELEAVRSRTCGWIQGADGMSGSLTRRGTYDFGTFPISAVGNLSGIVTVALYISSLTAGHLTYYAQIVQLTTAAPGRQLRQWAPVGEPTAIATPSATGWYTLDLTLPELLPSAPYGIAITGRVLTDSSKSATPDQVLGFVGIYAKADTSTTEGSTTVSIDTSWPKLSLAAVEAAKRSDDVYTAERLRKQQNHILGRYPRVLGAHAYGTNASTGGVALNLTYRIYRGPGAGNVTFYVFAKSSSTGHSTLSVTVGGTTSTATVSSTTGSGSTFVIPSAQFTPDAFNDVTVSIVGNDAGGGVFDTGTILGVVAVEDDYSASSFVVGTEVPPARYIGAYLDRYRAGDPIVADYTGGSFADWYSDRATLARNTIFQGIHRSALLINDWLARDGTSAVNSTTSAYSGDASGTPGGLLWFGALVPSLGTAALRVAVTARRSGVTSTNAMARLALWDVTSTKTEESVTDLADPAFSSGERFVVTLPDMLVTEGVLSEVAIYAGWIDAVSGGGLSGVSDLIVVDGVTVTEIARSDAVATSYLLQEDGTSKFLLESGAGDLTKE